MIRTLPILFCLQMLRAILHDEPNEPKIKTFRLQDFDKITGAYDRADKLGQEWDRELSRDEAMRQNRLEKDESP